MRQKSGTGKAPAEHVIKDIRRATRTLYIGNPGDADALMDKIRASARRSHDWIAAQAGDPLDMLKRTKFEPVGFHPARTSGRC